LLAVALIVWLGTNSSTIFEAALFGVDKFETKSLLNLGPLINIWKKEAPQCDENQIFNNEILMRQGLGIKYGS
jgi:hypothetical protein